MASTLAVVAGLSLPTRAAAQHGDDPCASSCAQPGFMRRAALTGDWNGRRAQLEERGIELGASYAIEVFTAPSLMRCCVVFGVGGLSIDLDLARIMSERLGTIHVMGFGVHGDGLSEELQDIHGVSNVFAEDDVRLFEAWIEQPIDKVAVRAGLLAVDQEFLIASHSTVLMDATFGIIGQYSANVIGPVYPVAAPGVSARIEADGLAVRAAVYDGGLENEHGVPTSLGDSVLTVAEIELAGTMKLGGWMHSEQPDGLYAVFDRRINRHGGGFVRFGASPGGPVAVYADAGARIHPGRRRKHDFVGLGVAYSRVQAETGGVNDEVVTEATYQASITGWMTVQPDLQVVFQPHRTVLVTAVRTVVVF